MPDDAKAPDLGTGPYGVEHAEDDGFYYLTLSGKRTGKQYPLGKTAYRTARKLNDEFPTTGNLGGPADEPADPGVVLDLPKAPKKARTVGKNPALGAPFKGGKPVDGDPYKATAAKLKDTATHSTVVFQGTREEWLNAFVAAARPIFAKAEHTLPDKVRVSVGFPLNSRGGKVIGQCWSTEASGDGFNEIFVTPSLDDTSRIAGVLTHELCHAATPGAKHGPAFKKCAVALGLEGKMTATTEGEAWHEWADPILADLGPIPHAALDASRAGIKKQTTRLIKCECDDCGFTFRATAKWVSEKTLVCPDAECTGGVTVTVEGE